MENLGSLNIVDLVEILALEPVDTATFEGRSGPAMGPRLFGGHAIAQALLAASAVEDGARLPHSLHAHFLKAGSSAHPVRYTVTQLSSGRSFAVRRVDGFREGLAAAHGVGASLPDAPAIAFRFVWGKQPHHTSETYLPDRTLMPPDCACCP